MKFSIFNLIIQTIVNFVLVPTIRGSLPFHIHKNGKNPKINSPMKEPERVINVQNDAKGEILTTITFINKGIREIHGAKTKSREIAKFLIPKIAKNTVVKIEKWNLCMPKSQVWPFQIIPSRKVLLKDGTFNPTTSQKKCYVATGPENDMKASVQPCKV